MARQSAFTAPSPSSSSSSSWFSKFCSSALRSKALTDSSSDICVRTSDEGLVRRLGLFDLILFGVGASIGAGIFVVTGVVARDAGPGVTISFILAGVACVLNALCYAELVSRFPAIVGGAYLYAYTAFNELTAFLVFAQVMLDCHIGTASIARSLASNLTTILELFPFFKGNIPSWIGPGGKEFFGGVLSINMLAPILLAVLTIILCCGIGASSVLNSIMTSMKVIIILLVIIIGAFEVDVSNWSPFAPYGYKAIVTGATVVFFAYVGYDAVANLAEESERPQRDLPLGILGSLLICAILYIGVCLVITGMVSYKSLSEDAPLAEACMLKGLKYVSLLVSIGAVAGLTTCLLVGLYVQSRYYLALGRDGLLPSIFAKVHSMRHTPIHSQVCVGVIPGILAGLFDVDVLSHILSVGSLTSYSVASACVVTLRWKDKASSQVSTKWISTWQKGVICLVTVTCCGLGVGLCYRFNASLVLLLVVALVGILAAVALHYRQAYMDPSGFSCPGVPILPAASIFFNSFLFAQLHQEAWLRFVVLSIIAVGIYAFYGQYHADPQSPNETIFYHQAPTEETQ